MSGSGSTSSGDRDPVERLAEEFVERQRRGERPAVSEYVDRHPQWGDRIREVFPALLIMERLKPRSVDQTGSFDHEISGLGLRPIEQLGDYRILREIGRGGMGVVYEAVQESLGRHVALKILPLHGRISAVQMERFRLEARSAARLHHTHIVPVYGVGEHDGVPYYAMQYIPGHGLDAVLDDVRRLRARGVATGDAVGIPDDASIAVARSLLSGRFGATQPEQPENDNVKAPAHSTDALDGETNGTQPLSRAARQSPSTPVESSVLSHPTVSGYHRAVARLGLQVADALGHAHQQGVLHRDIKPSNLLLDVDGHVWVTDFGLAKLEGSDGPTETGDIVGTLRYMAPERFEGWSDRRSDIYGLGMTLYELLTLRPAFDAVTKAKVIDQVIHEAPAPLRRHDAKVPRDLETIVMKAIMKAPADRYATADALAADLKNFLADRPIVARRSRLPERAWRWCRRNPAAAGLLAASGIAALAVLGVIIGLVVLARLERAYYFNQIVLAEREWHGNNAARAELILDRIPANQRGWEWNYLKRVCHSEFEEITGFTHQVFSAAFSPDGRKIATASSHQGVLIWDAATRRLLAKPAEAPGGAVSVAFSRDGKRLAAGVFEGGQPAAIWIGSSETGREERRFPAHVGIIWCVAFSPDGRRLASAGEDGKLLVWDTETGALVKSLGDQKQEVTSVTFSADGRFLASATGTRKDYIPENTPGAVTIWDTATWREVRTLRKHTASVNSVAFSPDGRRLVSASSDRTVKLWDTATGDDVSTLLGHTQFVVGVAFSPSGRQLVSASEDGTLRVWDADAGETLLVLQGHNSTVNCVAYSPDGTRIASGGDDRTVKLWEVDQPPAARILGGPARQWFTHVAFRPDGAFLAAANGDGTVTVWDLPGYEVRTVLAPHDDPVWGVAFSRTNRIAAAGGRWSRAEQSSAVRVVDWEASRSVVTVRARVSVVWSVAFSPAGDRMATGGGDFQKEPVELTIWKWDATLRSWVEEHTLGGHTRGISSVTFSPDGQLLASAANDGLIKVWDVRTGRCTRTIDGQSSVVGVAFAPDGKTLASTGFRSVTIWSVATGKTLQVLRGHNSQVRQATFRRDGQRLASAGDDGTVRLWDVQTGQEVLTLRGHRGPVSDVAFSPQGQQLVSASRDGTVRVWDGTPWPGPRGPSGP